MIPQLNKFTLNFPSPMQANEDGIVAWGGDLNPTRLLRAYYNGIFPWYSKQDPILWWSPDPRLIMELDEFKISKSLRKSIKKFTCKIDTNFSLVMHKCATINRKGQQGSWIHEDVIEAYTQLHHLGHAHSIETYQEGELVGGLYGVVVGSIFCGESMFSEVSDASKVAYAFLVEKLKEWNYAFIDCQVPTQHLKSLGAKEISRDTFLKKLAKYREEHLSAEWQSNV